MRFAQSVYGAVETGNIEPPHHSSHLHVWSKDIRHTGVLKICLRSVFTIDMLTHDS